METSFQPESFNYNFFKCLEITAVQTWRIALKFFVLLQNPSIFSNCCKIHIPLTLSTDTVVQVWLSKTPSNKELRWKSRIFWFPEVFLLVTEMNYKKYNHNTFLKYNHNTSFYIRKGRKELFSEDSSIDTFKKQEIYVPREVWWVQLYQRCDPNSSELLVFTNNLTYLGRQCFL